AKALSPHFGREPPPDLDFGGRTERLQPSDADHVVGVFMNERSKTISHAREMPFFAMDEKVDLLIVPWLFVIDVFHHARIGREPVKNFAVSFTPFANVESFAFDSKIHLRLLLLSQDFYDANRKSSVRHSASPGFAHEQRGKKYLEAFMGWRKRSSRTYCADGPPFDLYPEQRHASAAFSR